MDTRHDELAAIRTIAPSSPKISQNFRYRTGFLGVESTGMFDNVMIIMRIQTICTTEIVESLTIDLKLGIDRHFAGIQMRYRFEGNKSSL